MTRVYVAGPYTIGDVCVNVANAIDAAEHLLRDGFYPYVPHLSHFHHYRWPHTWEEWLEIDLVWLDKCDALLRLPGESKGADKEVKYAYQRGIEVFYSHHELVRKLKGV